MELKTLKQGGLIKAQRIFVKADDNIEGSFIAPDGLSKIEIPKLEFIEEGAYNWIIKTNPIKGVPLNALIKSELFTIYPKSNDILLYIVGYEKHPRLDAGYDKNENVVILNVLSDNFKNLKNGKEIKYRTNERGENNEIVRKSESGRMAYMLWVLGLISHELQHFVQREEGRNPSKIYKPDEVEYDKIFSEIEARESQLRESDRSKNLSIT